MYIETPGAPSRTMTSDGGNSAVFQAGAQLGEAIRTQFGEQFDVLQKLDELIRFVELQRTSILPDSRV